MQNSHCMTQKLPPLWKHEHGHRSDSTVHIILEILSKYLGPFWQCSINYFAATDGRGSYYIAKAFHIFSTKEQQKHYETDAP